jgi:hypothetical protein
MPKNNQNITHFELNKDNIDITTIQKMMFIYNSLYDGWVVKKLDGEKFEFIKTNSDNSKDTRKEINLENFIKNNLNLNRLIN